MLFRPGAGIIWVVANSGNNFWMVFYSGGGGIGGYNLTANNDQIITFDYNGDGLMDHILLYRPGTGICWIEQNVGGVFSRPIT